MKTLLLTALAAISLSLNAQKSFIGQTEDQVRDYWSTRESSGNFLHYDVDPATQHTSFVIWYGYDPAEFEATFIKGKCISNEYKIEWSESSMMEARIKKMGFTYSKNDDCWYNMAHTIKWSLSEAGIYLMLRCEKIAKK